MRPTSPAQLAGAVVAALVLTVAAGSGRAASGTAARQVVGIYSLTTWFPTPPGFPSSGPEHDTVVIEQFDRTTGRISGRGSDAWETMRGTVAGDRITMQLSTPGDVPAHFRGAFRRDGTVSGPVDYGLPGVLGRGTWRMARLPVAVRVGYTVLKGSPGISYGAELRNTSQTQTLIGVRISVDALSATGRPVTVQSQGSVDITRITSVPPGATVYLGHVANRFPIAKLARVVATPTIESIRADGRPLPRVTNVQLDLPNSQVIGTVTNTTGTTMRVGAGWMATAALYDRRGRIIGGGNTWYIDGVNGNTPLRPGHSTSLRVGIPPGLKTALIAAAQVSVTNLG